MKSLARAVALVSVLVLSAQNTAFADHYISDAVKALGESPVYVAPGTEGTDHNTSSVLRQRLSRSDNILLVMLPADAEQDLGTDINGIVRRLSEELGNQHIIGLAVGDNVVAYASILPAGVAEDQMRRANSVSNDPITALGTFTQNIRLWQEENPTPLPVQPEQPSEEGGLSWLAWVVISCGIAVLFIGVLTAAYRRSNQNESTRTSFKAPDTVKDLLARIARKREHIQDRELKDSLYQMCVDIEKYFQRSSKDKKRDARFFNERLVDVDKVVDKYIDIQNNQRYYHHPKEEMVKGKESLISFSQFVLESIRRGNAVDLFDYIVNTRILEAQRSR